MPLTTPSSLSLTPFPYLSRRYWTSRKKHGAKVHGVRFYCKVSRGRSGSGGGAASPTSPSVGGGSLTGGSVATGSASNFYDDDDDGDLLSGIGGAGSGSAYAPAASSSAAPDDLALFGGMSAPAAAAPAAERLIFDHDSLQVKMRVEKNPLKSNGVRMHLTASTVVGDASELRMMCAVPKAVTMTIGTSTFSRPPFLLYVVCSPTFYTFLSSFLIGTPSGNVLATPLAEVTQTIDLINNRPGSNITFKLRVVWTKGTTSKKKTVEVKL